MASQAHAADSPPPSSAPRAEDIADIVTDAFASASQQNRWVDLSLSSVTFSGGIDQLSCHAHRVTPKPDRFLVHSFTSHVQRMKPQSMSLGELKGEFAATCTRSGWEHDG